MRDVSDRYVALSLQAEAQRAGDLKSRIKEIAQTRVFCCAGRVGGHPKRIYRLYNEMGLQLRNKTPKHR